MSDLPWGGKPSSPTENPNQTGPGQNASDGLDPTNVSCDCVCSANNIPWSTPPDGPYDGPGGDPSYASSYYRLKRCKDDAEQPAWVQANEFDPGDVFIINTNGVSTCFYVDTQEVDNSSVNDVNVVRPRDIVKKYADCTACLAVSDLDIVEPPLPPTSYVQMKRCDDDSFAPYWLPREVHGIPASDDLSKIYDYQNVCYYASNNINESPKDPLLPVMSSVQLDDCDDCVCQLESAMIQCALFESQRRASLSYTAVISGINVCGGCVNFPEFSPRERSFTGINGSHKIDILPGGLSPRSWYKPNIGVFTTIRPCGSSSIVLSSPYITMTISESLGGVVDVIVNGGDGALFYSRRTDGVGLTDCSNLGVFNNEFTEPDCITNVSGYGVVGYGGTITITCP